jgi:hypothetical protein
MIGASLNFSLALLAPSRFTYRCMLLSIILDVASVIKDW